MKYEGEENLEILKLAENYNSFLVNQVWEKCQKFAGTSQIVDFGSGTRYLTALIEEKFGQEILCVEPAENLKKFYVNKRVYNTLSDLPDGCIDYIYSLNVLEHIKNDQEIVDLCYQKLKPGGRLFLYVPAYPVLFSSMDKKVGHFRRYSKCRLRKLFGDQNKWRHCRLTYCDFLGFFMALLFKIIGNKEGKIRGSHIKFYDSFVFPLSRLLDRLTGGKLLGKNLLLIVEKKD